jgi:copper chaperone CopZ
MDRRGFLLQIGATAVPAKLHAVKWRVRGFTCIACAVGLETMLRGLAGVVHVKAEYPANTVSIDFDESRISQAKLKEFIGSCSFSVV